MTAQFQLHTENGHISTQALLNWSRIEIMRLINRKKLRGLHRIVMTKMADWIMHLNFKSIFRYNEYSRIQC